MTQNQIAFFAHRENVRSNRAREDENTRHNIATEGETMRHNYVTEIETTRSNQARERETKRSNLMQEKISLLNLSEGMRHNIATESETQRSNMARENLTLMSNAENMRHNIMSETNQFQYNTELQRHNIVSEYNQKFANQQQAMYQRAQIKLGKDQLKEQKRVNSANIYNNAYEAQTRRAQTRSNISEAISRNTQRKIQTTTHILDFFMGGVKAVGGIVRFIK